MMDRAGDESSRASYERARERTTGATVDAAAPDNIDFLNELFFFSPSSPPSLPPSVNSVENCRERIGMG